MRGTVKYTAHPYGTTVLLCPTEKALKRAVERFNLEDPGNALGVFYDVPGGPLILSARDGCALTLVHECTHATLAILAHVGIDPREARGEPMAYLLEHMLTHFIPHLVNPDEPPASPHPGACTDAAS